MSDPGLGLDLPAPDALVGQLLARVHGGADRPLVVLDPRWPAGLRDRARLALAAARDDLRPDDLVLFTSGSSGRPRGVVRSLTSWTASLPALESIVHGDPSGSGPAPTPGVGGMAEEDPVWVPGPLTSTLFLYGAFHAAWSGRPLLTGASHDPTVQRATCAHLVPLMLADALDAADQGWLPRLRTVVVAGASLPASLRRRAAGRGWRVVEYYGAAELSFVGFRIDDGPLRPFPGAQVRITTSAPSPTVTEAPAQHDLDAVGVPGTSGSLWVRSPYLARRYLDPRDDGPWQRAGDWSTVHDRGRTCSDGAGWTVLGRGAGAITTGGATVVAGEVEDALQDVPGVRALAVVALAHPRFGQVVAVLVEPEPGADRVALAARLREHARELPAPARPRRWTVVDRMPRLPSGKVDRGRAAEAAATGPPLR